MGVKGEVVTQRGVKEEVATRGWGVGGGEG